MLFQGKHTLSIRIQKWMWHVLLHQSRLFIMKHARQKREFFNTGFCMLCVVWVNTHTLLMQRGLGTEQTPPYAREGKRAEWSSGGCGDIPSCCNMAPLATPPTPCSPVFKLLCYYPCLRLVINVVKADGYLQLMFHPTPSTLHSHLHCHTVCNNVSVFDNAVVWSWYHWWHVEIRENKIFLDESQFFLQILHQRPKCHYQAFTYDRLMYSFLGK